MYLDDPHLEQRLSRFEAQLDRFSLVLHQWQESQDRPPAADAHDLDGRIRMIEQTLDREALAMRQLHEEPLRQLQEQAASLRDLCATASISVNGLGEAEARLMALQANVQLALSDLSRSVEALVTNLQVGAPSAVSVPSSAAPWPLDRVVHLHDELRRSENGGEAGSPGELPRREPGKGSLLGISGPGSETKPALANSVRVIDSAAGVEPGNPAAAESLWRQHKPLFVAGGVIAAVLLVVGLAGWIESRLNAAATRVAAAEREVAKTTELASREAAAARRDADRQITEARQLAQRAETVGSILTAPDLVRLNLTAAGSDRSSAQVLWSRTRGLVLSGSRLPAAPPEATYQLWLVTGAEPVSAGLFVPDATGKASLVVDVPPRVVGPVVGASVTVEPRGGRLAPSGPTLLARFP
jgi:hypothetical protein